MAHLLAVQLIHPGGQKSTRSRSGHVLMEDGSLYRTWNSDSHHYRKFLKVTGRYVLDLHNKQASHEELFLWGEWEGPSLAAPVVESPTRSKHEANAIHTPLLGSWGPCSQNTDPNIFGERFKYAVCNQKGKMTKLAPGSMILFGTTYRDKDVYALDTVFVVKEGMPSQLALRQKHRFSRVYRQMTLDRITDSDDSEAFGSPGSKHQLYQAQMWTDDRSYFSYAPAIVRPGIAHIDEAGGSSVAWSRKLLLPLNGNYGGLKLKGMTQGFGAVTLIENGVSEIKNLWRALADEALQQGFVLAVCIDEPTRKAPREVDKKSLLNADKPTCGNRGTAICHVDKL